ncbi:YceD family protein [bacterium]|nr:YceD family protein [bacterium]
MKINIQSLKEDPVVFPLSIAQAKLDLGDEARVQGAVSVILSIHKVSEKVFIRGEIHAQLQLVCARCLEAFERPVDTNEFFLMAVPFFLKQQRRQSENEQLLEDDPATIVYEADQLDLLPEIRNFLILNIPMKPLCSLDCQGICSRCGKKKQDVGCTCRQRADGNSFSVLEELKPDNR